MITNFENEKWYFLGLKSFNFILQFYIQIILYYSEIDNY